jgi:hypothetical protein
LASFLLLLLPCPVPFLPLQLRSLSCRIAHGSKMLDPKPTGETGDKMHVPKVGMIIMDCWA